MVLTSSWPPSGNLRVLNPQYPMRSTMGMMTLADDLDIEGIVRFSSMLRVLTSLTSSWATYATA